MGKEVAVTAEEISVLAGDAELGVFRAVLEGTGESKGGKGKEDGKDKKDGA
jgi:hypothetical protein